MLSRLDERRAIMARLDAAAEARRTVNDRPEVIAARAKMQVAREAMRQAEAEFNEVFNVHIDRDDVVTDGIVESHPDVFVLGNGYDDTHWIARCAVTGLPLFYGDAVYEKGGEEDYQKTFVLADAVTINSDLAQHVFEPIILTKDIKNDDEDEADDSDGVSIDDTDLAAPRTGDAA